MPTWVDAAAPVGGVLTVAAVWLLLIVTWVAEGARNLSVWRRVRRDYGCHQET
jgi:hypothetical protein